MDQTKDLLQYVREELTVLREQGCDTWELEREAELVAKEDTPDRQGRLKRLCESLEQVKPTAEFAYCEPSDLEGIRRARPDGPRSIGAGVPEAALRDRTLGGWLGRVAGCMLGKPVEGWKRQRISDVLRMCGMESLDDYFPEPPAGAADRPFPDSARPLLRGHVTCGVRDDDTDYTIVGLRIMEKHGKDFTPDDVANFWLDNLPYMKTCTAERVAYRNLVNGIRPPASATYRNPYREWIGAQIRADAWGYACPGRPQEAATLAFRDASISHVRNGIYGEMWVAAMLAAAFVARDAEQVVRIGLSEIPAECRLAEAIEDVVAWRREDKTPDETLDKVLDKYGRYHPVHTINNAAIVATGILWGGGDFTRSIGIAVSAGLDTDCNGATVGSVVGAMIGAAAIPAKWVKPLNDRLLSVVAGDSDVKISNLAERTMRLQKLRASG
jgi:ADP-ribosylglycohydrolase